MHSTYSLSILKRQLERGRHMLPNVTCLHDYFFFNNSYIFARNILNARNKEYIYKNILVVLLNKNYFILFNGKNEIWHLKNAHVPDLLYALSICAT